MNTKIYIYINIHPLNSIIEKEVINKLDLEAPKSYAPINKDLLDKIYNEIKNKYPELTNNFSKEIILSIRATLMRSHMINNHKSIQNKESYIVNDYENNMDIIDIVKKYDGSPLNLLRLIFKKKYNLKLSNIIKNHSALNTKDEQQLQIAIKNDAYALVNQDKILKESMEFEDMIGIYLKKNKIRFKTQDELSKEQIENNNHPTNTPDFLILDDLYINGIKINWIDAKNFYGSNSKFIKNKIKKQTEKYLNEWGSGSIIFRLGFNSKLNFPEILLIDYDSLILN